MIMGRLLTYRNRYPDITAHRAPHKPFLLISIMDLIAQGQINENFIEPSYELLETWNTYYSLEALFNNFFLSYPQEYNLLMS
jgi:predicted restriction endonuclease